MQSPLLKAWMLLLAFLFPVFAIQIGALNSIWPALLTSTRSDGSSAVGLITSSLIRQTKFDFWQSAEKLGDKVNQYTQQILLDAAVEYAAAADEITKLKVSMAHVVADARQFHHDLQHHIDENGLSMEDARIALSAACDLVLDDLQKEFSEPLPEDQSERYRQREIMIDRALDKLEPAINSVTSNWGFNNQSDLKSLRPHVKHVLLITGNLIDNHPILTETIIFAVTALLIPERWVLQPFLTVFGFGPAGPVKGSAAAWAQRHFWGEAVKEGSWFARLQAAGMRRGGIGKKIGVGIGIGAGVGASLFGCGR